MTPNSESKQALFIATSVVVFVAAFWLAWQSQQAWLGWVLGIIVLFAFSFIIARYMVEGNYYRRVINACLLFGSFFLIPVIHPLWELLILFISDQFPQFSQYVQAWQSAQKANKLVTSYGWIVTVGLYAVAIAALKADAASRQRTSNRDDSPKTAHTNQALRDELLRIVRTDYEEQLRQTLPTPDRIPVEFSTFKQLNPQRNFRGRISARKDLNKAFAQSRADKEAERLLVVGDPGAGKSIALLHLATVLADRAKADPSEPVPILFSLGGWSSEDVIDWMVATLTAAIGILLGQTELARQWCEQGVIAPLFDGLDELADDDERRACRDAINRYLSAVPDTPVVVACRVEDYTRIHDGAPLAQYLALNAGIRLEPLTHKQIIDYLAELAKRDPSWKEGAAKLTSVVKAAPDGVVISILKLPLWLSLLEHIPSSVKNFCTAKTPKQAMSFLLESYLSKVSAQERHYLAAIAGFLTFPNAPDRTTFYLERLTGMQVPLPFRVNDRLLIALLIGLSIGLIFLALLRIGYGIAYWIVRSSIDFLAE